MSYSNAMVIEACFIQLPDAKIMSVFLVDYFAVVLPDAVLRDYAAYAGCRVDVAVAADDCAGVADGVAADFYVVAEHSAEFLNSCLHVLGAVVDDDKLLIALYVRGNGACAHVAVVSENGIAYIIVVRSLNMVEKNDVLELDGVADYAVRPDQRRASDKRAVTDLCLRSDDAGRAEACGGENLCCLVNPDMLGNFFIVIAECGAELKDKLLDAL